MSPAIELDDSAGTEWADDPLVSIYNRVRLRSGYDLYDLAETFVHSEDRDTTLHIRIHVPGHIWDHTSAEERERMEQRAQRIRDGLVRRDRETARLTRENATIDLAVDDPATLLGLSLEEIR
jgi:hypothetical protein